MQKVKKLVFILVVLVFSAFITSLSIAYANSPPPPGYLFWYVTNIDSSVSHVDILIKIDKSSEYYTDLNTSNAADYGFTNLTPVVAYSQDGYMSISFHCINVHSNPSIPVEGTEGIGMSRNIYLENSSIPISAITNSIKIALLDKDGNILKVSDAVSIIPSDNDSFPHSVRYDAASKAPVVEFAQYYHYQGNSVNVILPTFLILAFLIRMAISTAIETLIAIPFKIRPLWKIVAINIVTQILLFAFIELGGLDYTYAVIIGEIFVYISEFMAYVFLFKNISKPKLALYTATANTISLVVGLILNSFHVLVG